MIIKKHVVFAVCLLLLSGFSFSQSHTHLYQVKPKWKLGDQKKVHTRSVSRIFIKDSLVNNTEITANYSIKVIDTVKNYTLSYVTEPDAVDIEAKSSNAKADSVLNLFTGIIKKIQEEAKTFKYELVVDKNTGQAEEVKNSDEYFKVIEDVASRTIDDLGEEMGKTKTRIDSMKQQVIAYSKLAEPKILKTVINGFNYMMQPYSYNFPINSTISQKEMVHDVNAMGEFGNIEIPAVLTISSKRYNDSLTIQTDMDYDKDFLLEQIKKKHKDMSDVTSSDIFLSEKVQTVFAITKGWIVSHKSDVVFKMKDVKEMNETNVSFQ